MKKNVLILSAVLLFFGTSAIYARPTYTGYSGAPGSNGSCASSCHGSSGGTIQVSGFPEAYVPGQTYTITLSHDGGNSIKQFNGSCRVGFGSQNAGVISAGSNTATYSIGNETNGIHLSSTNQHTGAFDWEAPSEGAGDVRLYIAGHQGSRTGPNTSIVLSSFEATTGTENDLPANPTRFSLLQNYPNPFNASTTIEYSLPEAGHVSINIYNLLGRQVLSILDNHKQAGANTIIFDASELSSGVYFYRLQAGSLVETKRMLLLK